MQGRRPCILESWWRAAGPETAVWSDHEHQMQRKTSGNGTFWKAVWCWMHHDSSGTEWYLLYSTTSVWVLHSVLISVWSTKSLFLNTDLQEWHFYLALKCTTFGQSIKICWLMTHPTWPQATTIRRSSASLEYLGQNLKSALLTFVLAILLQSILLRLCNRTHLLSLYKSKDLLKRIYFSFIHSFIH